MAMVAAALRREVKRVITVRSSILYDKCMHLARMEERSYTSQFNLNMQRTTPSMVTLRAHHTFNNAYKKPGAGYFGTSAAKFTTAHGEVVNTTMEEEAKAKAKAKAKQGDESSNITKRATPIKIRGTLGAKAVSILFRTGASHSVINAQTAKVLCLETKPTTPTTVTMGWERLTCDTKCVIEWQMHNLKFTWTFLVMPLASQWDMVLGVDWMKQVSPLKFDVAQRFITITMPDGPYVLHEDGARD